MFEYMGREDGERDGNADACDGLSKHPRPDLKLSLISNGYQESYFNAYHGAYNLQKRVKAEMKFRNLVKEQQIDRLLQVARWRCEGGRPLPLRG